MSIIADFLVSTPKGFYCQIGDFYIDPSQAVKTAVISHAHADHAVAGNKDVYCTKGTAGLMQTRYKLKAASNFYLREYQQTFSINNIGITFFSAGHILGSAQILLEYGGVKYLYSGDIKLQQDPTCEATIIPKADVLITETTFGNPDFVHADANNAIAILLNRPFSKMFVGCYAMGKAQRVTHLFYTHNKEIPIYIHPEIIPYHNYYEHYGIDLGKWKPFNSGDFKDNEKAICILPPALFRRFPRRYGDIQVFATGWKRGKAENTLPISDHIDWNDLLYYIEQVSPTTIYTIHGDGSFLQQHFSGSKISIHNLSKRIQKI